MLTIEEAVPATDYLRSQTEVQHTHLGSLLTLFIGAVCSYAFPRKASVPWFLFLLLLLVLGPLVLPRLMPKGNLLTYRIAILAYPVEGLLLGFIAFMEIWKVMPLDIPGLPTINAVFPWLSVLFPVFYYVQQFPNWRRRIQRQSLHAEQLAKPAPTEHVMQIEELLAPALGHSPTFEDAWAEFTTVPATLKNWRLYLQLDAEYHGVWRVSFNGPWALVAFVDGTRVEVVKRGELKTVADDPQPGRRKALCLLRWNKNLFEGRITHDNFLKIHAWNANKGDAPERKPPPKSTDDGLDGDSFEVLPMGKEDED